MICLFVQIGKEIYIFTTQAQFTPDIFRCVCIVSIATDMESAISFEVKPD